MIQFVHSHSDQRVNYFLSKLDPEKFISLQSDQYPEEYHYVVTFHSDVRVYPTLGVIPKSERLTHLK